MADKFYITTPIYYANGSPHIGHFLTTTIADVLARYYRTKLGESNVFFTTGLDEHGTTVEQAAIKDGYAAGDFQSYVDKRAKEWELAFNKTNISFDYFVRTTNEKHKLFAQEFIRKMVVAGDVYKDTYKGKYCTGCEKFLTLSDLNEAGHCPLHRAEQTIETEEQNYFFKLKKYSGQIAKLIEENKITIFPESKRQEMLARLAGEIEDISISRPKSKVGWGIEFPNDNEQTIYVWVEALMNYMSSLQIKNKAGFFPYAHHLVGKDINWFHNVIWPAFLLSAGHPLYRASFVHGYLTVGGAKISKSLGNVITPNDLVERFGIDGARYLVLSSLPYDKDSDVTLDHFVKKYNADLANGLGNLIARVAALCEKADRSFEQWEKREDRHIDNAINKYKIDKALQLLWERIKHIDQYISSAKLWEKEGDDLYESVLPAVKDIRLIAHYLLPIIPDTAKQIAEQFGGEHIKKARTQLFPRLK